MTIKRIGEYDNESVVIDVDHDEAADAIVAVSYRHESTNVGDMALIIGLADRPQPVTILLPASRQRSVSLEARLRPIWSKITWISFGPAPAQAQRR